MNFWGIPVSEAVTLAAAGAVPRRFYVHKFGKSDSLAAGDAIMEPGGAFPYLTYTGTALAMRIKANASGAADDTTGTGARSVTIQGLDENFAIASETVATNGTSASTATTTTFSRVLRVFVATTGTGRTNDHTITIEDSGGAADYAFIAAGDGQSQIGAVTVPAGYHAYLTEVQLSSDAVSGTATVTVDGIYRTSANQTAAPFDSKRLFYNEPALSRDNGIASAVFDPPLKFDEYTDIWFEGTPSTGTPIVDVEFTVLFEKD